MRRARLQSGQASVELVAAIPLLIALLAAGIQLALAGYALWTAGSGARAGARAAFVGGDAAAAARSAIPAPLADGARVREEGSAIEVTVSAPALIPGLPRLPVSARAGFDVAADG